MYLVLRKNRSAEWLKDVSLDSPIFHASLIDLCVLAPKNYYNGYQLGWLEIGLNDALNEIIQTQFDDDKLEMSITSYWPTPLVDMWDKNNEKTFQPILHNEKALKSILKDWNAKFKK